MRLSINQKNTAGHYLDLKYQNLENSIEVDVLTVDEYFSKDDILINFIKMDVEGAESNVIQGMNKVLKNSKNLKMIVEYNPMAINQIGLNPKKYLNLLTENNFNLFDINEQTKSIRKTNSEDLLNKYENLYTNLFCHKI